MIISISNYTPLRGGTYRELPDGLKNSRGMNSALCNIKNDDNHCFDYSYLAAKHYMRNNANRQSSYKPFLKEINNKGIEYPMKRCDIPKFEKLNNCKINVFRYSEKSGIYPFYLN